MIAILCVQFSKHLQSLLDYCKTGEDEGAMLVYGGKKVDRKGTLSLSPLCLLPLSSLPPSPLLFFYLLSLPLLLIPHCLLLALAHFPPTFIHSSSLMFVGFFMEPTIFTNVEDHMFIAKEESFGPVMVISIFENG